MTTRIVAGRYKRRVLSVPEGKSVRPTLVRLRESLFDLLGSELDGMLVCDLFAGSGSLGIEALSRGAAHAVFVENHPEALRCLEDNIAGLGIGDVTEVAREDVFSFLDSAGRERRTFDIAFADPGYDTDDARRLLLWFDRVPATSPLLCIEHREEGLRDIEMKNGMRMKILKAGDKRISIYLLGGDS